MEISIDLTELNSQEIIEALERYPYGHLEIKSERIFWLSRDSIQARHEVPSQRRSDGLPPQRKPDQMNTANRAIKRSLDTLGAMVC
jgi:hypothetical protein